MILKAGDRIEIPTHSDLWMRGARFGTVKSFHSGEPLYWNDYVTVKLDHPSVRRLFRLYRADWDFVKVLA